MAGNGVLNFASAAVVFDPAKTGSAATISGGGLIVSITGAASLSLATAGTSSEKKYCEFVPQSGTNGFSIGIAAAQANYNANFVAVTGWGNTTFFGVSYKQHNGASAPYGTAFGVGDVMGIALDMVLGQVIFYKNNVSQGVAYTGLTGTLYPGVCSYLYPVSYVAHFDAASFVYSPPAGFTAF